MLGSCRKHQGSMSPARVIALANRNTAASTPRNTANRREGRQRAQTITAGNAMSSIRALVNVITDHTVMAPTPQVHSIVPGVSSWRTRNSFTSDTTRNTVPSRPFQRLGLSR